MCLSTFVNNIFIFFIDKMRMQNHRRTISSPFPRRKFKLMAGSQMLLGISCIVLSGIDMILCRHRMNLCYKSRESHYERYAYFYSVQDLPATPTRPPPPPCVSRSSSTKLMTARWHDYATPPLFVRMIFRDVAKDEGVDVEEEGGFWGMDNCYRMMQKLPVSAAIICCAMIVS